MVFFLHWMTRLASPSLPFFLPKLYYEDRETETAHCNAYFVIRRLFLTTSLLFVHFLFEPFFFY